MDSGSGRLWVGTGVVTRAWGPCKDADRAQLFLDWHGIELDSCADGVPGWSGTSGRSPLIAPGDSFAAEFTPPRAGTFMYHSHSNENHHHGRWEFRVHYRWLRIRLPW